MRSFQKFSITCNTPGGRFHEKSQTEPDSRLSQGLKSETFVSAEFLAQMDFTKGGSDVHSLAEHCRVGKGRGDVCWPVCERVYNC